MMTKRVVMRRRLPGVGTLAAVHAVHLPVLAGALLLVVAGLNKIWRPGPTARAVRTLAQALGPRAGGLARGFPSGAVRALGAVEVLAGTAVVASPWRGALWASSALYAAFALFVVAALATGAPLRSCGCFGQADAPPHARHVAMDVGIAALGVAAATDRGLGAARDTFTASSGLGAVLSLALAALGWLALQGAGPLVRRVSSR